MLRDNLQFNEKIKPNSAFLEDLSRKLPDFFTAEKYDEEGNTVVKSQFDLEKFQKALKEQNVEELSSGYQIDFIGKNYAKKQAGELPTTVIVPDNVHNEKKENKDSNNIFLTGDNLEVLRHLQQNYSKSVDFIYIDPPYNTGSDGFVYPDTFEYSDDQLKDMFGLNEDELKRLKSIQGKSTHSAWLTFMYPRLYLAKKLLKDTGIIFISIDDNEQANLKLLMDDVYGESGFVATIPVINNLKGNQDQFAFAGTHEYLLVFSKNINLSIFNNMLIDDESIEEWEIDEVGFFKKGANLKATGANGPRERRPNLFYPIYIKRNKEISLVKTNEMDFELLPITDSREMSWRWSKETMSKSLEDVIVTGENGNYSIYKKQRPMLDDLPSKKAKSFFYKPEYSSGNGTSEIKKIFGERLFPYPKSTSFIKDLLQIGTQKESLILDFFAGSSTTADAVLQLNKEDSGNRKFIMCTLPESTFTLNSNGGEVPTKGGEVAFNAGYKSIDEISRERIIRAATKIKAENPLLTETLDFGFKHYRVVPARQDTLDKLEFDDNLQLDMFDDMISSFSSEKLLVGGNATGFDTILQTYLVKDNYKFDVPVKMIDFKGIEVPYVNNQRVYIITENWTSDNTKALVNAIGTNEISVQTIVVYGYTMDMERLRELEIALSQLENKVNLLVRY